MILQENKLDKKKQIFLEIGLKFFEMVKLCVTCNFSCKEFIRLRIRQCYGYKMNSAL